MLIVFPYSDRPMTEAFKMKEKIFPRNYRETKETNYKTDLYYELE